MSQHASRKGSYIAPKRVEVAFGPNGEGEPAIIPATVAEPNTSAPSLLRVWTLSGAEHDLLVRDPAALGAALDRDDLTRFRGHPLALVNLTYGLIGVAIGPAEPPNRLEVLANVVRLAGERGAVEIPGPDDQPSWLLFELASDPEADKVTGVSGLNR